MKKGSTNKKGKSRRKYYNFQFLYQSAPSFCLEIGAYSVKQLYKLAWMGYDFLKKDLCLEYPYNKNYQPAKKPKNLPEDFSESEPFVMYNGKILKF
ncbi:MAG: hypothetical protein PHP35_01085 [Candidatus Colwellbacteria bacterium]|nr:hypothetical protein [Candidatus Colwellbacteria bacterium]